MSSEKSLLAEEEEEMFRRKVDKFCSESSVFALTRIHSGSRVQRCIWALMFLFMLAMFCYQVSYIFITYYSYPSEMEVRTHLAPNLAFPAVTVCNLNPARRSVAEKMGWGKYLKMEEMEKDDDDLYEKMMEKLAPENSNMTQAGLKKKVEEYMDDDENDFNKWDILDDEDESHDEEDDDKASYYETMEVTAYVRAVYMQKAGKLAPTQAQKLAHRKKDLFVSCKWLGYQCSPSNFTTFLDPTYGVCHTFNSGRQTPDGSTPRILTVPGSGSHNSLQVEFNIEQQEYINSLSPHAGLRVQIHQPDRMPFPGDEGFSIPPGYMTSVGIKLNRFVHLPPNWGDCEPSVDKQTLFTKFGANYSIQACLKTCLVELVRDVCGCVMLGYPTPDNATSMGMCRMLGNDTASKTLGEDAMCVKLQIMNYLNGTSCDCPRPCMDDMFPFTTSSSLYPSEAYEKTLKKKVKASSKAMRGDDFDIEGNIVKLEVYFQDMQYTETKALKAYESDKLFSDLGGMLGLWLGFSFITVAEFGEFFLDSIKTATKKCFKKRKAWPSMTNLSRVKGRQIQVRPSLGLHTISDLEELAGNRKAKQLAVSAFAGNKAA